MKTICFVGDCPSYLGDDILSLPLVKTAFFLHPSLDLMLRSCDALILTSKNAILALEHQGIAWKQLPCYALGKQTKRLLQSVGVSSIVVARGGYGAEFAEELKILLEGKRALYVRGREVASKLRENLNGLCGFEEVILYETQIQILKQKPLLPKELIVIFSAPSRVDAFLNNFAWQMEYFAICIGKTTAKHLTSLLGSVRYCIAREMSLRACVEMAREVN